MAKPKARKKKYVPMQGGKVPNQSTYRKELNPKQKKGAAHMEKRQKRLLKKKRRRMG